MSLLSFAEWWAEEPAREFEARLPRGVRQRELSVKGLLIGMLIAWQDRNEKHLTRVETALASLDRDTKARLGIPSEVSYRHVERTFNLMVGVIDPEPFTSNALRAKPKVVPSRAEAAQIRLTQDTLCDLLLECSVPESFKQHACYAVDWTDVETWARRRRHRPAADPTARDGRRRAKNPSLSRRRRTAGEGSSASPDFGYDEAFFGFKEQAFTMVPDEGGQPLPELVRRHTLTPADTHQPPVALQTLLRYREAGLDAGDLLADAEYPFADGFIDGVVALGFAPVAALHSLLLGRRGTHEGAIVSDGELLCPCTPPEFVDLKRPARSATQQEQDDYVRLIKERARWRFGTHGKADEEGYQRARCPAERGSVRCPLKPKRQAPLTAAKVFDPPKESPRCCRQQTITIPPDVVGKLKQKHPYHSVEHLVSYNRRTAVERSFAYAKDQAAIGMRRGSIRVMGQTKVRLVRTIAYVAQNYRLLQSFYASVDRPERRSRKPRRRRFKRETLAKIATAAFDPTAHGPPR